MLQAVLSYRGVGVLESCTKGRTKVGQCRTECVSACPVCWLVQEIGAIAGFARGLSQRARKNLGIKSRLKVAQLLVSSSSVLPQVTNSRSGRCVPRQRKRGGEAALLEQARDAEGVGGKHSVAAAAHGLRSAETCQGAVQ